MAASPTFPPFGWGHGSAQGRRTVRLRTESGRTSSRSIRRDCDQRHARDSAPVISFGLPARRHRRRGPAMPPGKSVGRNYSDHSSALKCPASAREDQILRTGSWQYGRVATRAAVLLAGETATSNRPCSLAMDHRPNLRSSRRTMIECCAVGPSPRDSACGSIGNRTGSCPSSLGTEEPARRGRSQVRSQPLGQVRPVLVQQNAYVRPRLG